MLGSFVLYSGERKHDTGGKGHRALLWKQSVLGGRGKWIVGIGRGLDNWWIVDISRWLDNGR
jgi:hypothetical protein